ncbi:MAG: GNAT family N-acetyltransferase [Candidatus Saccharibacteria bacterium]
MELQWGEYRISSDKSVLSLDVISGFLATSYWAKNRPLPVIQKSIENSNCFGVYHNDRQVGFARVITDYATVFYLSDVFIIPEYQGRGLGKWLVGSIVNDERFAGLAGVLGTRGAEGLYEKFGYRVPPQPTVFMARLPVNKPD